MFVFSPAASASNQSDQNVQITSYNNQENDMIQWKICLLYAWNLISTRALTTSTTLTTIAQLAPDAWFAAGLKISLHSFSRNLFKLFLESPKRKTELVLIVNSNLQA